MAQENKFEVEITARIDQLEKSLKQAESSIKKAGAAASSEGSKFAALGESLSVLNVNFGGLGVNVGAMVKGFQAAAATIKGATLATRGFGVALAATGIGAIVVALGLLISAFMSTQRGTDAVNRVMMRFKYGIDAIVGLLQGAALKAFDGLTKAFKDPKQAVIDLWEAIKTNLMNRLEGVVNTFKAAGKIIGASLRLDWKTVEAEAKNFGNALVQTATGVSDLWQKVGDVVNEVTDASKKGAEIGDRLANLDKQIALVKRANTVEMAKQEQIMREQQRISRLQTISLEEQQAAHLAAVAAMEKMQAMEQNLAQLQLKRLKLATKTSDTPDKDKQEIAEQVALLSQINARYASMGREMDENNRRIQTAIDKQQQLKSLAEMTTSAMKIDQNPFEDFAKSFEEMPEIIKPDIFITQEQIDEQKKLLDELAMKYNALSQSAEILGNAVGNIVNEGFQMLFDSGASFNDFANVVKRAFIKILSDMAAAAAKALVLRAIMGAFTGGSSFAVAGVGNAIPSFGQLFSQNMGGGSMAIRGQDIVRVQNTASTNTYR